MKKFTIEVPEGMTRCEQCPFWRNYDVCQFLDESHYCDNYNFEATHLWDLEEARKNSLELENTEFDYGHNVNHNSEEV